MSEHKSGPKKYCKNLGRYIRDGDNDKYTNPPYPKLWVTAVGYLACIRWIDICEGFHAGYVHIPSTHLFVEEYVGLCGYEETISDAAPEFDNYITWSKDYCNEVNEVPGGFEGGWWLGFDCGHYGQSLKECHFVNTVVVCEQLARKLKVFENE